MPPNNEKLAYQVRIKWVRSHLLSLHAPAKLRSSSSGNGDMILPEGGNLGPMTSGSSFSSPVLC